MSEIFSIKLEKPIGKNENAEMTDDEIDKYWAERDAYFDKLAEKIDWAKEFEIETNNEMSDTPMYDFGLGKMSNELAVQNFYGYEILKNIREEIKESYDLPDNERRNGHISKELLKKCKDIRFGKTTISESSKSIPANWCSDKSEKSVSQPLESVDKSRPKKEKHPMKEFRHDKSDGYYLKTTRGVIKNKAYRETFKGPGVVYEWLWSNIVRSGWVDHPGYPIKEKYFDNGFLAYCSSYRKIADECGLHKNKVKEYIDRFVDAGVVKIKLLMAKGKRRAQSVFILGEWENIDGKIVERFYRETVFAEGPK